MAHAAVETRVNRLYSLIECFVGKALEQLWPAIASCRSGGIA